MTPDPMCGGETDILQITVAKNGKNNIIKYI